MWRQKFRAAFLGSFRGVSAACFLPCLDSFPLVFPLVCSALVFLLWSSFRVSFAWILCRVFCCVVCCVSFLHVFTWQRLTEKEFHNVPIHILYGDILQAQGKEQGKGIAEEGARWNRVGPIGTRTGTGVPLERGARGGHGG